MKFSAPLIGHCAPLGSTVDSEGVNFSIYSRDATGVELLFFDSVDDLRPHVLSNSTLPRTAVTTIGTSSCPA